MKYNRRKKISMTYSNSKEAAMTYINKGAIMIKRGPRHHLLLPIQHRRCHYTVNITHRLIMGLSRLERRS